MTPPRHCFRWALAALFLFGTGLAQAAPRSQLLRYVPDDTALCVLLEGLRERGDALAASPFVARLAASPLAKSAGGLAEVQRLLQVEKQVERFTGLTAQRLREEIFGDLVVLAYKPGPPGRPDQEQGLVLVHARDPQALAEMVRHINDSQKKSEELKALEQRKHRGLTYFCRQEKMGESFYYLTGPVLVFSGQEAMLKRALDLNADLKPEVAGPVEQSLERLGVAGALVTFWVNPRAFDAELAVKLERATQDKDRENEAAWLTTFQTYWKALDGLALAVQLDADLTLALALSGKPEQLPAAARAFLARLASPSPLWRALPEETLFALAGRLDFKALLDALIEFAPAEKRPGLLADLQRQLGAPLGKQFVRDVLPALGPDVGLIVLPPAADARSFLPQALLALRVRPGDGPAPVDRALLGAVDFAARLAVISLNRQYPDKTTELTQTTLDRIEIRYLAGEGVFPPGVAPAFALARGHLVLASSPEALRTLAALLSENPAPPAAGPVPILRISFAAWRTYLQQRQTDIVRQMTADGTPAADAQAQVAAWIKGLEWFDRLEVRHQPGPERVLLQISLRTAWPLK